jgi:Patatin-like phospholipase
MAPDNETPQGKQPIHFDPFGNIALAFSGGGFRAASFSLGVLAYLNRLSIGNGTDRQPLLERVRYISSASGGTITNAHYALHKARGKDFNSFYSTQHNAMQGEGLLEQALDKLNRKEVWERIFKKRNIINSFALSYDGPLLFNKATLGELRTPASP